MGENVRLKVMSGNQLALLSEDMLMEICEFVFVGGILGVAETLTAGQIRDGAGLTLE